MNIFKNKKLITMAMIFSTLMVLTHQHLPAVFTAASAGAQLFGLETVKKPCFVWGGFQLGGYGKMVGIELSLSAQLDRKWYGSVYKIGASEPFGNDAVHEYGFMVGRCSRTRRTFAGAAAGIGVASGWIGSGGELQGVGVPLKLEGSLIIGGIMALNLQFHAFIWKRSYAGMSLGLQLGKLR